MKRIVYSLTLCVMFLAQAQAQVQQNVGVGYFGNTVTYPGLVLEYGLEKMFTAQASLPLRLDVGFYHHKRYNTGVFADVNLGFRRYYASGLFLEESIGVGWMSTFVASDEVFSINDAGELEEASRYASTDVMPSITLGIGYDLTRKSAAKHLIWLRPKIFWQFPHKTTSFYSVALQVGYTYHLK
ncbi:hypothetical protein [Lishizhenia sp.]|uniref:hypothetical protein n=1 Tax=Lishizhenia sp. TaxID=2497594 RepID=UPI00299F0620|nr:hypothetical protein [Lishizhenia sp.]MDX1446574.1 hypothetical protein [Lishizhenia sp.]